MSTRKYRITLSADLESNDYDNERMDVSVTFIAHNTLDVYNNVEHWVHLLEKSGLSKLETSDKYTAGITEGVI
jgi:hypothetical protein